MSKRTKTPTGMKSKTGSMAKAPTPKTTTSMMKSPKSAATKSTKSTPKSANKLPKKALSRRSSRASSVTSNASDTSPSRTTKNSPNFSRKPSMGNNKTSSNQKSQTSGFIPSPLAINEFCTSGSCALYKFMKYHMNPLKLFKLRKIISSEMLDEITVYKFIANEPTPLDKYIVQPWWRWLLNKTVPSWIHPNLLTLMGTIPLILLYGYLAIVNPTMGVSMSQNQVQKKDLSKSSIKSDSESGVTTSSATVLDSDSESSSSSKDVNEMFFCPDYLLLLMVFFEFFYQTLDGLDGLQARKTGTASVLGCLFDHGCDCLANIGHSEIILTLLTSGTIYRMEWYKAYLGLSFLFLTFFLAQWKHHLTGIHCINSFYNTIGISELQFFVMFLILSRYYIGQDAWGQILDSESPLFKEVFDISISNRDGGLYGWACFCGIIALGEIPLVLYYNCKNAYDFWIKGLKQLLPILVILHPLMYFGFPLILWESVPGTRLLLLLYSLSSVQLTLTQIIWCAASKPTPFLQPPIFVVGITAIMCLSIEYGYLAYISAYLLETTATVVFGIVGVIVRYITQPVFGSTYISNYLVGMSNDYLVFLFTLFRTTYSEEGEDKLWLQTLTVIIANLYTVLYLGNWVVSVTIQLRNRLGIRVFHTATLSESESR